MKPREICMWNRQICTIRLRFHFGYIYISFINITLKAPGGWLKVVEGHWTPMIRVSEIALSGIPAALEALPHHFLCYLYGVSWVAYKANNIYSFEATKRWACLLSTHKLSCQAKTFARGQLSCSADSGRTQWLTGAWHLEFHHRMVMPVRLWEIWSCKLRDL